MILKKNHVRRRGLGCSSCSYKALGDMEVEEAITPIKKKLEEKKKTKTLKKSS